MDIYLSEEEAKKVLEEMSLKEMEKNDNQFPEIHLPKKFIFDKLIMNNSKKRYTSSIVMKEGELL